MAWLVDRWQWPAATLFASAFLVAVLPALGPFIGLSLVLVLAQLPAYMIHQFEEHHDDCFCHYVNGLLAGGRLALTPGAAFIINSVFVWGVDLVALYLAAFVGVGYGLIAVDLALVNGTLHIVMALVRREYNPGLWTALAIFLPLGAVTYGVLLGAGATVVEQSVALAIALVIHVGIVVNVRRRIAHFPARSTTQNA